VHPSPGPFEREKKKDKKVKPKRVANEAARLESSKEEEEEPFNKFFFSNEN
jgi:hypothetical protein